MRSRSKRRRAGRSPSVSRVPVAPGAGCSAGYSAEGSIRGGTGRASRATRIPRAAGESSLHQSPGGTGMLRKGERDIGGSRSRDVELDAMQDVALDQVRGVELRGQEPTSKGGPPRRLTELVAVDAEDPGTLPDVPPEEHVRVADALGLRGPRASPAGPRRARKGSARFRRGNRDRPRSAPSRSPTRCGRRARRTHPRRARVRCRRFAPESPPPVCRRESALVFRCPSSGIYR
jgi:hypothetical protein